ncbi:hypothetical protein BCR44DRAFT_71794 [Catenaria anguillulae PL171]|uniref:Uncharacterized protein n=1 Tax=Catenaria anguillulae PL171 TaxID=765915 RepID=A0A1Y2I1D4_9FUNG|nr:hypothetical protein BCR44DRAFT_71794 [Catenaria anguillulae PL171]
MTAKFTTLATATSASSVEASPAAVYIDLAQRITNGDGAGPITAAIDPMGTGQSFPVNVPVTQQCNPRCVLRITQPTGFGSCGVLTTGGQGAGNDGGQQPAPAPGQGQVPDQPDQGAADGQKQAPVAGGANKQAPRRGMNGTAKQSAKKSMSV